MQNEFSPEALVQRYKSEKGTIRSFFEELPLFKEGLALNEYAKADGEIRKMISENLRFVKKLFLNLEEAIVKKANLSQIGKTEPIQTEIDSFIFLVEGAGFGGNSGTRLSEEELQSILEKDYAIIKMIQDMKTKIETQLASNGFQENEAIQFKQDIQSAKAVFQNRYK